MSGSNDDENRPKHPRLTSTAGWDEDTPEVASVPLAESSRGTARPRATNPDDGRDSSRNTARAAMAKISELSKKLDEHSKVDKEGLDKIEAKVEKLDVKFDKKIDEQAGLIGNLREDVAAATSSINSMTSEMRHIRDLRRVEIESTTTTTVALEKTKRASIGWRSKATIAVVGALGTAIGALLKWLSSGG